MATFDRDSDGYLVDDELYYIDDKGFRINSGGIYSFDENGDYIYGLFSSKNVAFDDILFVPEPEDVNDNKCDMAYRHQKKAIKNRGVANERGQDIIAVGADKLAYPKKKKNKKHKTKTKTKHLI